LGSDKSWNLSAIWAHGGDLDPQGFLILDSSPGWRNWQTRRNFDGFRGAI